MKRIFSGILCAAALAAATQTVSAKEAAAVESTSVFNRSYNVASSYPNAMTDLTAITDLSQQKLVDETVRKILNDKATSKNEAELAKICETKAGLTVLRAMPSEVAIRALTNWWATLTPVHIYYKQVYGSPEARKTLIYNWKWNYEPLWALTDKVALAWGSGFVADASANSLYEVYLVAPNNTEQRVWSKPTYNYAEYDINAGAAVDVDIKNYKTNPNLYAGGWRYRHQGTYKVNLTLNPATFALTSAKGCYVHTKVLVTVTIGFSGKTPGFEISGWDFFYEKSDDTAVRFYTTIGSNPGGGGATPMPV